MNKIILAFYVQISSKDYLMDYKKKESINIQRVMVQFFFIETSFPNFDGSIAIFPNSTGPWPCFQKCRKIPD